MRRTFPHMGNYFHIFSQAQLALLRYMGTFSGWYGVWLNILKLT
ncbi:MAG: hypothetical protein RIC35_13565 [Marinoscillum sp.]